MITDAFQAARVTLVKFQPSEAQCRRSFVACLDEVSGNVDANDFRAHLRKRDRRRAISATKLQSARNGGVISSDSIKASPD